MSPRGKFIVFEGGEGVGKSTLLYHLQQSDIVKPDTVFTREPGGAGATVNKEIRHILMEYDMDVKTETLLFLADRTEHLSKLIRPAIQLGTHVFCDRYEGSTEVYQCYTKGLDRSIFRGLRDTLGHVTPDVVFWLDMDAEKALQRRRSYGHQTKFDKQDITFHEKIRKGFSEVLGSKENTYYIDASRPEKEVLDDVINILSTKVPEVLTKMP